MHTLPQALFSTAVLSIAPLVAQSFATAPQQNATLDAIGIGHVPGAITTCRQQLLVGASHLTNAVGHSITAIEWRRSASDESLQAGACDLAVELSIAPHTPFGCSSTFAANAGTNPVQVFAGTVAIPASPPEPNATVAWDADNVIRVTFTTPFVYTGGTLCIDLTGTPIAGQEPGWWVVDAAAEDLTGQTVELGGGCGDYGGESHLWSFVAERSLVPGGYASMHAYGTPFGLGVAAIGQGSSIGTPLGLLGLASPAGCALHLSTADILIPTVFVPDPEPLLAAAGGRANVELKIPAIPQALGFTMTTQWLDWSQMATSNAVEWTVAGTLPTLDMAMIEGHPLELTGVASAHRAPIVRFEFL